MKSESNLFASCSASVDLPELVVPTITMRLWGNGGIFKHQGHQIHKVLMSYWIESFVPLVSFVVRVLPHINWVAKDPASFSAEIPAMDFKTINSRFGGVMGHRLLVPPCAQCDAIL